MGVRKKVPDVIIIIEGGVAHIERCPDHIEVLIIDRDVDEGIEPDLDLIMALPKDTEVDPEFIETEVTGYMMWLKATGQWEEIHGDDADS